VNQYNNYIQNNYFYIYNAGATRALHNEELLIGAVLLFGIIWAHQKYGLYIVIWIQYAALFIFWQGIVFIALAYIKLHLSGSQWLFRMLLVCLIALLVTLTMEPAMAFARQYSSPSNNANLIDIFLSLGTEFGKYNFIHVIGIFFSFLCLIIAVINLLHNFIISISSYRESEIILSLIRMTKPFANWPRIIVAVVFSLSAFFAVRGDVYSWIFNS
jgi:hypothetical protein